MVIPLLLPVSVINNSIYSANDRFLKRIFQAIVKSYTIRKNGKKSFECTMKTLKTGSIFLQSSLN